MNGDSFLMKNIAESKNIKQKIWNDWFLALGITTRFINNQLEKKSKATFKQFQVLSAMEEMGETANATEMAKRLVTNANTISTILDRMERKGLVIKTRDTDDRRMVYLTFTNKGKKKLAEAKVITQKVMGIMTYDFSPEELNMMDGLIERLIKTTEKASKTKFSNI